MKLIDKLEIVTIAVEKNYNESIGVKNLNELLIVV